jgi:hypothetical protein
MAAGEVTPPVAVHEVAENLLSRQRFRPLRAAIVLVFPVMFAAADPHGPSAASYDSIQAAVDANPGMIVYVPAGEHVISQKIRLNKNAAGLNGPGRIVQTSADQPIVEVENAEGVTIRDVTLTRPEGHWETRNEGILAIGCRDLILDNVRVADNRTSSAAIALRDCRDARVSRCVVRNYMRVSVDDRTASPDWGYAFNCTDGTGISVSACVGTLIEGNRIVEENLRPTPDVKAKHKLGDWVKKNPTKGKIVSQAAWNAGYTDNWQQGSAIIVTSPEKSDLTRILGNHIENAAQGIDLHADHVIVANNLVVNSFVGMKAMHGSRNVIVTGNQFARNSLWAIGLMPGTAAHAGNADGGSIVANNVISDFGHGDAHWIWGDERSPIRFDTGQEPDDPPLADVVIQGNLIHNLGPARYRWAVLVPEGPQGPKGLHFSNNLFPPGKDGVANAELRP